MAVGTEVRITGRVQSRMYEKKHEDGTVEPRVAYEVSIGNLELVNKDEKASENEEVNANSEEE